MFTDIRAQFTVRVERTALNCLSVARVLSGDLALFFFFFKDQEKLHNAA